MSKLASLLKIIPAVLLIAGLIADSDAASHSKAKRKYHRDSTVVRDSIPLREPPGGGIDTVNPKPPETTPIQSPVIPGAPTPGTPGSGGKGPMQPGAPRMGH